MNIDEDEEHVLNAAELSPRVKCEDTFTFTYL